VSLAVGRVIPELGHHTDWPYAVLGAAYAVFGLAMVVFGSARQRQVAEALEHGGSVPSHRRELAAFTVLAVLIGLATLALILAGA
jgi:hypothetical protein